MFQLVQIIIVSITYFLIVFASMIFIQGFVYRVFKFSIYNHLYEYLYKATNQDFRTKKEYKKSYSAKIQPQIEYYRITK